MTGRCTPLHVITSGRSNHSCSHVKCRKLSWSVLAKWALQDCWRSESMKWLQVIIHNIITPGSQLCQPAPLSTCSGRCQWCVRGEAGVGARRAWARQVATTTTQWEPDTSHCRLPDMELKVWVEGIQRIVCGVTEKTTCQVSSCDQKLDLSCFWISISIRVD